MIKEHSAEAREFSSPFKERLKQSLQGAEINDLPAENLKDLDVFEIKVADHEKWKSLANAQVLAGEFGEIISYEFGEKDESGQPRHYDASDPKRSKDMVEYMQDGDLSEADKIIAMANQDGLVGFTSYKFLPVAEEQKVVVGLISAIDRGQQNKSLGRKLFELFFTSENPDVTIRQSCTPAAVKLLLEVAESSGYSSFYGNHPDGELGKRVLEADKEKLKKFTEIAVAQHKPWAVEAGAPEGYVVGRQQDSMPPLKREDIHFPQGDPLGKTFTDELMPLQEKNYPHTVFGIQITFKE